MKKNIIIYIISAICFTSSMHAMEENKTSLNLQSQAIQNLISGDENRKKEAMDFMSYLKKSDLSKISKDFTTMMNKKNFSQRQDLYAAFARVYEAARGESFESFETAFSDFLIRSLSECNDPKVNNFKTISNPTTRMRSSSF